VRPRSRPHSSHSADRCRRRAGPAAPRRRSAPPLRPAAANWSCWARRSPAPAGTAAAIALTAPGGWTWHSRCPRPWAPTICGKRARSAAMIFGGIVDRKRGLGQEGERRVRPEIERGNVLDRLDQGHRPSGTWPRVPITSGWPLWPMNRICRRPRSGVRPGGGPC
jgi:hypothetical protein